MDIDDIFDRADHIRKAAKENPSEFDEYLHGLRITTSVWPRVWPLEPLTPMVDHA